MKALVDDIKPGAIVQETYGKGHDRRIHILSIVEGQIVLKWYQAEKHDWKYDVWHPYTFGFACKGEHLDLVQSAPVPVIQRGPEQLSF